MFLPTMYYVEFLLIFLLIFVIRYEDNKKYFFIVFFLTGFVFYKTSFHDIVFVLLNIWSKI